MFTGIVCDGLQNELSAHTYWLLDLQHTHTHTHFQLAGRFRHKSSGKIINEHEDNDSMSDIHLLEKRQIN